MTRTTMTPDAAMSLQRLLDGNQRFINCECLPRYPRNVSLPCEHVNFKQGFKAQLEELADHQKPFAVILTCSDSRVCPEIIFDQGLGDIYTVRTAGNVFDNIISGSIEFAISRFSIPLVMVLGHSDCGAVKAAICNDINAALDIVSTGHVSNVVWAIRGSLKLTADCNAAVRSHVISTVDRLQYVRLTTTIVGAYYDMRTGLVEVLNK